MRNDERLIFGFEFIKHHKEPYIQFTSVLLAFKKHYSDNVRCFVVPVSHHHRCALFHLTIQLANWFFRNYPLVIDRHWLRWGNCFDYPNETWTSTWTVISMIIITDRFRSWRWGMAMMTTNHDEYYYILTFNWLMVLNTNGWLLFMCFDLYVCAFVIEPVNVVELATGVK